MTSSMTSSSTDFIQQQEQQQEQQEEQPILYSILCNKNSHPRDVNILFYEPTHTYTITTDIVSKYTSVTTFIHSHFSHFDADAIIEKMKKGRNWNSSNKYWGKTDLEIKDGWVQNANIASGQGTLMHFGIECFMNQKLEEEEDYTHENLLKIHNKNIQNCTLPINSSVEWNYFIQFIKLFPDFKPYRTEWTIYNEDLKLSGSIDMVYENPDGSLNIYDWKRAKEIVKTNPFKKYSTTECIDDLPDTNFWHYSLQLNIYKALLELKYNKIVKDLYLVKLHPDNKSNTFELYKCANLQKEVGLLFSTILLKNK